MIRFIGNRLNTFLNEKFRTEGVDYVVASDTDSVVGDTVIKTSRGDVEIQELWDQTDTSVIVRGPDNFIKSVSDMHASAVDVNGEHVCRPVNYIMKHRVAKRMYKINVTCADGSVRSVTCTCDHSLVVVRDGVQVTIKPSELQSGDLFLVLK